MTPENKLSPRVQALIAGVLLGLFAGVIFLPALVDGFEVEADTKQTLFTLVTAVVFFFIGKNTDSAGREAQLTAAAIAPAPPPVIVPSVPAAPVKIDDTTPIKTQEVKP